MTPPVSWEYRTEKVLRRKVGKRLNKLGADGWELVDRKGQMNAFDVLTLRRAAAPKVRRRWPWSR